MSHLSQNRVVIQLTAQLRIIEEAANTTPLRGRKEKFGQARSI
ncbi:MAG: hypothetical protein AAF802_21570 [Planctomycetota bacterium]